MISHHKQETILDCGVACIKTILSNFDINDQEVDSYFDVNDTQGMSLLEIEEILEKYNISSESYQVEDVFMLKEVPRPCILVASRNYLPHYIVLVDIQDDVLTLSDPAESSFLNVTFQQLEKYFMGIVLIPSSHAGETLKYDIPTTKETLANCLYNDFITGVSRKEKIVLFLLEIAKVLLPIIISLTLQYTMINIIGLKTSLQFFILGSVLTLLWAYKIVASINVTRKTKIENNFLYLVLDKFYTDQIQRYKERNNSEFAIGYFWNLLTSATGIVHKFYFQMYVFVLLFLLGVMLYFNWLFALLTSVVLFVFLVYNHYKLREIERVQREYINRSSNFSYLLESSIDGVYDIISFNKTMEFTSEFSTRLRELLDTKLCMAEITNQINISIQFFSVGLASLFLLSSHFFFIKSTLLEFSNIVLMILLLSSVLQPLLMTWISYRKSLYSLDFINRSNKFEDQIQTEIKLGVEKIKCINISNLSKKYDEKLVLNKVGFELKEGQIYLVIGENGAGKSTLLKILQGVENPTSGDIFINNKHFTTLAGTDFREYIGVYSNDFRVFSGTVENNMSFSLFKEKYEIKYDLDEFVGLPYNYQISSNGKNISKGQKQKILLLRAMKFNKSVYLFDEPTSNLDSSSKKEFVKRLIKLKNQRKIVLVVAHDESLKNIADNIIYLGDRG